MRLPGLALVTLSVLNVCARPVSRHSTRLMSGFSTSEVKDISRRTLVDFDANLCHDALKDHVDHHIAQGVEHAQISHFIVPGSTLTESAACLRLSEEKGPSIIATAGVHPYHVKDEGDLLTDANLDVLRSLLSQSSCKAVGETGLDYSDGFPAKDLQLPWFEAQVALALEFKMPLFLHVRDAKEDFMAVLSKFNFPTKGSPPVPTVVHCFTGDTDELRQYVDMGLYIGLTGYVLGKGKDKDEDKDTKGELSEWLRIIPTDRLVIETDAPYLGWKGCRASEAKRKTSKFPNVPASLPTICKAVAEASGVSYEDIAHSTTANALRFFSMDTDET